MAPQTKIDRSFSALTPALSEWIIEAVDSMGFVKTTPVQHAAIPMFMGQAPATNINKTFC
jgi:ATP-dependent RNA helicase DDX55/SPB4